MPQTLTYVKLIYKCSVAAKKIVPGYPALNTELAWQLYKENELKYIDENLFEEVLNFLSRWEWLNDVKYNRLSLEIALLLPENELEAAQSFVKNYDCESFKLHELAKRIVESFLIINITQECKELIKKRSEQADYKIQHLEAVANY